MFRTGMSIRTLQIAALAGACLMGTTAIAQSKGKSTGMAAKLRPVVQKNVPQASVLNKHAARPMAASITDPVFVGGSTPGPAPRGGGGSCVLFGGGGCIMVDAPEDCTNQGGTFMGAGSACPVLDCEISAGDCYNFEYPRVGGTSQASMGPGHTTVQVIADDFLTDSSGPHQLSQICWWGAYTATTTIDCNNPAPDVDHFFVNIFSIVNGLPDINTVALSAEQGVNMTVTRRGFCDTGVDAIRRLTYEYTATFDTPVTLNASSCYAIEIRNPNNNTVNWFWSRSADLGNNQCWSRSDTGPYTAVSTIAGDRAFCIGVGVNVFQSSCAVPPPPICSNPDTNGQPFSGANQGGFSASPSPAAVGLQLAERMQFENSGNITNVCFRGFWVSLLDGTQPTGPAAPDFDITYFANGNGQPGDVIAQYRVGEPGVNVFRNGFQYRIEHPALPVEAGTCYFFSISRLSENADPEHNLRWAWWLTGAGTVGDEIVHSRTAGGVEPGPWANILFGAGQGDIHFLMDAGPVQTPNCPADEGACCVGTTCSTMTEQNCINSGGVYQGNGVACNPSSCFAPPANDNCSAAQAISGEGLFNYDNRGATCEGNERLAGCDPVSTSSHSIWYVWTPSCDGTYSISLCGQTVDDTVLSVFDGTDCQNSALLGCDDDGCGAGGGQPSVLNNVSVVGGNQYLVRLASWTGVECAGGAGGAGTFTVTRAGEPCGPSGCPCDFNLSGSLNSQDFFDFLNCFFTTGCTNADFNNSGSVNSQDFFDFLGCFFEPPAGC